MFTWSPSVQMSERHVSDVPFLARLQAEELQAKADTLL
jgi:hypothetical protein